MPTLCVNRDKIFKMARHVENVIAPAPRSSWRYMLLWGGWIIFEFYAHRSFGVQRRAVDDGGGGDHWLFRKLRVSGLFQSLVSHRAVGRGALVVVCLPFFYLEAPENPPPPWLSILREVRIQ